MEKIKFDNFTINIDISNKLEFSTKFLFQILLCNVKNKLHIINYTSVDIDKIIKESKLEIKPGLTIGEHDFKNKIILPKEISKSISWIEEYARNLTQNDYLLIVGGEKLLTYSETKPIIKTKYFNLNPQVHFIEEENWCNLAEEIDMLFEKMKDSLQGIVININGNSSSRKIILEALNKSENMSITGTEILNQNEEYENLQKEIFYKFEGTSLSEILSIIESYKSRLDNITYNYMIAMAYLQNGDVSNTISVFESNYTNLRSEEKLILSDLLIVTEQKERAREILSELFRSDKYMKGLLPGILRLHKDSETIEQKGWIDIALKIDPLNPTVLEFYGNWLSNNKNYLEAAKVFRQLRDIMKSSSYFELVARMNDLLNSPPPKVEDAEAYIYNVLEEKPELKNEAMYRLAKFYISCKESLITAYSILKSADLQLEKPRILEITKLKLDILSDVLKASKALRRLKPFSVTSDANLLNNERSKVLLECIPILASSSNGYLFWRSFIESCQSDGTWKISIYDRLKETLIEVSTIDYSKELDKSHIRLIEDGYEVGEEHYQGIILLRRIKSGEFSIEDNFSSLKEFTEGSLKYGEVYGDNEYKLWCRYYLSIILSLRGEYQLANNYSLSILEYYSRVSEPQKSLCIYLGLLSWGNSQYRMGREVEGIACVISTFKLAKQLKEFYPFVEEGINIIVRFLSDNSKMISKNDTQMLNVFYDSLKKHNSSLNHIWPIINGSSDVLILELENDVKCAKVKDADWAGKLANLISVYTKNSMEDKAVELIKDYGDEAIKKLSNRMDVRFKIIHNWAQIYFFNVKNVEGFKKALELLEQAIEDIEQIRKVYHQEERASIGEAGDEIYRFYLQICSILFGLNNISDKDKEETLSRIENILPKISPRSIIEQKNYNIDKDITPEMKALTMKLKYLTEDYNNLYIKNSSDYELLANKAREAELITEELKKIHPHYKSLPFLKKIKFENIQESLINEEVFYQYFITQMTVSSLLITKDSISFKSKLIEPGKMNVEEVSKEFGLLIQQYHEERNNDIENITLELSRIIVEDLIEYVSAHNVKRVYLMQDFKMGLFPVLITSINDICLIDKVTSIVNIIDYSVIGQRENYETKCYKVANRVFGRQTNTELNKINKWLESKNDESFIIMENQSDSVEEILEFNSNNNINTMTIYGHGVPDPKASRINGSQGIQGQKKLIRLDDILDNVGNIRNFILISCGGGSPNSDSPENSSGSWANIFEKFCGNIVSCKWDVPADSTIFIINEMFDLMKRSNLPIDEALILAQREAKIKYKNPMYWAGIEFWEN